jgi:hypothetical protein
MYEVRLEGAPVRLRLDAGENGTGQATIKVSISYPGTTFVTQLTAQITITR